MLINSPEGAGRYLIVGGQTYLVPTGVTLNQKIQMTHVSETDCTSVSNHCKVINADLGYKKPKATFGLRLLLKPTIVNLNYLLQNNSYKQIDIGGLSGGGWATTLIAATDERIKYSFPIFVPLNILFWNTAKGEVLLFQL